MIDMAPRKSLSILKCIEYFYYRIYILHQVIVDADAPTEVVPVKAAVVREETNAVAQVANVIKR